MRQIEPTELKAGDLILDVRTAEEHRSLSLAMPHWNVELSELDPHEFIEEHALDGTKPLYLICRAGHRSSIAASDFQDAGFSNVAVVKGGIMHAMEQGIAVNK